MLIHTHKHTPHTTQTTHILSHTTHTHTHTHTLTQWTITNERLDEAFSSYGTFRNDIATVQTTVCCWIPHPLFQFHVTVISIHTSLSPSLPSSLHLLPLLPLLLLSPPPPPPPSPSPLLHYSLTHTSQLNCCGYNASRGADSYMDYGLAVMQNCTNVTRDPDTTIMNQVGINDHPPLKATP